MNTLDREYYFEQPIRTNTTMKTLCPECLKWEQYTIMNKAITAERWM